MSATPTVTVRGEGRVEGPPELATVTGTVHASGRTSAQVTAALAAALRQLEEARPDIAYEGVYTESVRVTPVIDHRRSGAVTGYAGNAATRLVLSDFDRVSEVVVALGAVGDVAVGGSEWSLRHDSPLYRQARTAAVHDAYARARDYAAAVGGTLGELQALSDTEAGGPVWRAAAMSRGAAAPEPSFDLTPRDEVVTAQVTATFVLDDVPPPGVP